VGYQTEIHLYAISLQVEERDCPTCYGSGFITCINCKGDGLAIPVMLNKRTSRDPETRLEEYGLG
jgi:DnaJ-class molecular chaperone